MSEIKVKKRSRVLLMQYFGVFLLTATGWAWNLHKLAGIIVFVYGVWVTANAYKNFKEFLHQKWKKE